MFDAIQRSSSTVSRSLGATFGNNEQSIALEADSAPWNMVHLERLVSPCVSKILNRPDLCDDLCANAIPCSCCPRHDGGVFS